MLGRASVATDSFEHVNGPRLERRPDLNLVWEARLDGVAGRIEGALWTANVDQLAALRENTPRLG
jgi:hypothetical protein